MLNQSVGNTDVRIYIGSRDGVDSKREYAQFQLEAAIREARQTLNFNHPLRIAELTFMDTEGVTEKGWEVAANQLPSNKMLLGGGFSGAMHKLARELCTLLNQRKVVLVTNYETVVIYNKSIAQDKTSE